MHRGLVFLISFNRTIPHGWWNLMKNNGHQNERERKSIVTKQIFLDDDDDDGGVSNINDVYFLL